MSQEQPDQDYEVAMLDPEEAGEEIASGSDAAMDSDGDPAEQEQLEIQLRNDSVAHFDGHAGTSIFCIAQHPIHPSIIATGGGDDSDEGGLGVGFMFDCKDSWNNVPQVGAERQSISTLTEIKGHTDSISAITFTQPRGEYLVTAGLDGRLIALHDVSNGSGQSWKQVATTQEVNDINWLAACPSPNSNPEYANTIALGAQDGSVWVYTISSETTEQPLNIVQTYYVHTDSCTAGAWTPDGKLLVTVAEDNTLYVWDVWGEGAAAGLTSASGSGQAIVGLTAQDVRFNVDGGFYSLAIAPDGAFVAAGGIDGNIRVIGLPRLSGNQSKPSSSTAGIKSGAGAKNKAGGAKQAGATKTSNAAGQGQGQAGTILASLKAQDGSIETLDFSLATGAGSTSEGNLLLASGSVDGTIVIFDATRNFSKRRTIQPPRKTDENTQAEEEGADENNAIVKVEFVRGMGDGWMLTSAGYQGVLQRWDLRSTSDQGLVGEWKGHSLEDGSEGIQGFVQALDYGAKVVTAGDDGIALVFDMASFSSGRR